MCDREQSLGEIAVEAHHQGFALGIAKANIIFEDIEAIAFDHKADKHHAAKRRVARRHRRERGAHHFVHYPRFESGAVTGQRGVRAHSSGVRAAIVVEHRLMILRAAECDRIDPVAQREERKLFAACTLPRSRCAPPPRRSVADP